MFSFILSLSLPPAALPLHRTHFFRNLRYDAACCDPTFRTNVLIHRHLPQHPIRCLPTIGQKPPPRNPFRYSSCTIRTLKMKRGFFETSGTNYPATQRDCPQQRNSLLHPNSQHLTGSVGLVVFTVFIGIAAT